jgi:chemotaxis protein histidine kinase CheA
MDGEIRVRSAVGKGSTFTLSLPRAPLQQLADRASPMDVAEMDNVVELADRAPQEKTRVQGPQLYREDDERDRRYP